MKSNMYNHQYPCWITILAFLLICRAYPCSAQAQPSTIAINQPIPNTVTAVSGSAVTQTAKGLNVTVDSRWLDGQGYRPLRISITPNAAVAADRELIISIAIHQPWSPNDRYILCEQFITIPGGTSAGQQTTTTISVPPVPWWIDFSVEVNDPALTSGTIFKQQQLKGITNRLYLSGMDVLPTYPHILFVGSAMPDTSAINTCMPQSGRLQNTYQVVGGTMQAPTSPGVKNNAALPSATALLMSDLPERWIDYSSLDVVCLSMDQLSVLAQKHPAAYRALLEWTESGGNLWIYGIAGTKGRWDRLDEIRQLLKLPADKDIKNWIKPSNESFGKQSQDTLEQAALSPDGQPVSELGKLIENKLNPSTATTKAPPPPKEAGFLIREYGMGTVAAIASEEPFAGNAKWSRWEWDWLIATTGKDRLTWSLRHGMEVGQVNADYWNFLIPGVGLAPVRTFQVLITLFVLCIGPANYWLLWSRKKLHLIVLTVPISAVFVTVALFSYALFADGLGTRVRVRSVTKLDQARGTAVSWARISYYAGLSPSNGLTFSENAAVYPILDKSVMDRGNVVRKRMLWENDQCLVQGWLNSRTPTQYLVIRSAPSRSKLKITPATDSSHTMEVENRLGVFVERVAIRDLNNKYYLVNNIGVGGKALAKETSPEQITSWLSTVTTNNLPEYPPGLDQGTFRGYMNSRYNYMPYNSSPTVFPSSILEQTINCIARNPIPNGITLTDWEPLIPRSYIALTSSSPEVELGTDSAKEESSFHVIVGEW